MTNRLDNDETPKRGDTILTQSGIQLVNEMVTNPEKNMFTVWTEQERMKSASFSDYLLILWCTEYSRWETPTIHERHQPGSNK